MEEILVWYPFYFSTVLTVFGARWNKFCPPEEESVIAQRANDVKLKRNCFM